VSGDALVVATEPAAPYVLGLGFQCPPIDVPCPNYDLKMKTSVELNTSG
jgi:hypothetical protein